MLSLGRTSGFNKLNTLFVPVSLPAGQWRPLHKDDMHKSSSELSPKV